MTLDRSKVRLTKRLEKVTQQRDMLLKAAKNLMADAMDRDEVYSPNDEMYDDYKYLDEAIKNAEK